MTQSDPTLDALKRLDEPGAFIVRKNVPIFMEHDDAVAGTKVDKARLQELAEINNRRTRESGTPGSIVIGHTPGRKEEEIQHVGYKKNYHVGTFGPEQKLGLLCDFYYKPEKYSKAMEYPHRSIELWNDGIIDTVSVLARTPQLDLGLLIPEAGPTQKTELATFGKDGAELLCYSRGGERRIYQLCEESPMDNPRVVTLLEELNTEIKKLTASPPDPKGLVTYSKEDHQKLLDEHVKLKQERDEALKLYQKQGRQTALETLKNEGVQLDVDAELADAAGLDDAAFSKQIEKVKKCYQRSPVGGGFIQTVSAPNDKADYNRDEVRSYATKHSCSIPDAIKAVKAGKA